MKDKAKIRASMADRHSHAAQARMKAIAQLAADEGATTVAGSKRRGKKGQRVGDDGGEDDGFGANDEDWAVYREISREVDR